MFPSGVLDGLADRSDLRSVDDAALLERSHLVEMDRRRIEADQIRVLAEIETRCLHQDDGHRGIDGYGRGVHRWTSREARERKQLIRLGRAAPEVVDRLSSGALGVAQANLLAVTFSHSRVGDLLIGKLTEFLELAACVSWPNFEAAVVAWRLLMDTDGPDPERAMRDRSATLGRSDHTFDLHANGPIIDGVELDAILTMYEQAEHDRDWAWTRDQFGDTACEALMPRTRLQRRYDALVEIFGDAVARPPGSTPIDPLVNLMIDQYTYAETIATLFGDGTTIAPTAPAGTRRFSQTTDGQHIPPKDVVLASLYGQIRRVITDGRGVVLDMGHKTRLFTGPARAAVMLIATRCTHPGCLVAASNSQADHLTPHTHGGPTSTSNGGIGCGHHNRWRYLAKAITTLDHQGRWITQRPDGTNIAPPDHPHPKP
jgi:hypothetical protein